MIEANEFLNQANYYAQPYYWNCSTYLKYNHTGECYRAVVPITPEWGLGEIDDSNKQYSPVLNYNVWFPATQNWRVWVCGMGGSDNDDSIHMGSNGSPHTTANPTATKMEGYSTTNWVWKSERMNNGGIPKIYLESGYELINLWARENGMRVDRILLARDDNYNSSAIRCGANQLFPPQYPY